MGGWETIRSVQELCESLRRNESGWLATHFAELKTTRWTMIQQLLQRQEPNPIQDKEHTAITSFSNLRPRVLSAWDHWLFFAANTVVSKSLSPPSTLVTTPAPLGTLVAYAAAAPDQPIERLANNNQYNKWVSAFAAKPADIQLLVWLHMLAPRPVQNPQVERLMWNAVTVIQNSSLPFVLRAHATLASYRNLPNFPISPTRISTNGTSSQEPVKSVRELATLAVIGGVGEHWNRSLWESRAFDSTPQPVRSEIERHLVETKTKAPEPERVYQFFAKLDTQNKRLPPFQQADDVVSHMLYITHCLATLDPQRRPPALTVAPLWSDFHAMEASSSERWAREIVHLAHILHLHSLMTVAQIRRAVAAFWTLAFALQSTPPS